MSDEWSKYKKILDRENEEFRRAMEPEISTPFFSKFSSKYIVLELGSILLPRIQ